MSANNLIDIKDRQQFNQLIESDCLVVTHFMAEWAQQCRDINDVFTELSKNRDYTDVKFAKVSAEDIPELSKQMSVTSVPTCILFNKSKELSRVEGADVSDLTKKVKQFAFKVGSNTSTSLPLKAGATNIEDRLKALLNRSPVMVFMKGCPETPRCGFSRTLVSILNEINAKYDTFDILSDEEVRQSLKTYSNWPTYPQIYVNGNLIGGLDIIKELKESGELEEALKG